MRALKNVCNSCWKLKKCKNWCTFRRPISVKKCKDFGRSISPIWTQAGPSSFTLPGRPRKISKLVADIIMSHALFRRRRPDFDIIMSHALFLRRRSPDFNIIMSHALFRRQNIPDLLSWTMYLYASLSVRIHITKTQNQNMSLTAVYVKRLFDKFVKERLQNHVQFWQKRDYGKPLGYIAHPVFQHIVNTV